MIVFGNKQFGNQTILFDAFREKFEKKDFDVVGHVGQRISRDNVAYIASSSGTTGILNDDQVHSIESINCGML